MDNQSLARELVMGMSRKDYVSFAEVVKLNIELSNHSTIACVAFAQVARDMAVVFKRDNSRFDKVRFFRACGLSDDGRWGE
jgi:hypothetical protein